MPTLLRLLLASCALIGLLVALNLSYGGLAPPGELIEPWNGLMRTARQATHPESAEVRLAGLAGDVTVLRDERGVPHIFARSEGDAVQALGFVVAQDRLFQLFFIPMAASGRLSELFGASTISADRYLRSTGMEMGAAANLRRIEAEGGEEKMLIDRYAAGVNAVLRSLSDVDLPFEFRLFGYRPARFEPIDVLRLLEYMTFDLTFRTDRPGYDALRRSIGQEAFTDLFAPDTLFTRPIVPDNRSPSTRGSAPLFGDLSAASKALRQYALAQEALRGTIAEGFIDGKGSNNWAVAGSRSTTGAPILAGDMHLGLTLPAIWYEVQMVTPTFNSYGVTFPCAPLPVEAFNDRLGWTFTNTGTDQIDYYALALDGSGRRYQAGGAWHDLTFRPDTIFVRGAAPVIDTLVFSDLGPVLIEDGEATAFRWTGHAPSRALSALLGMNRAGSLDDFTEATRKWDAPMQNILYADIFGNIAIRATGRLPRRGPEAVSLGAAGDAEGAWNETIPFDELPSSINPERGWLASMNQDPVGAGQKDYLGYLWAPPYRSMRIESLMASKRQHSVEDLMRYQADVHAVQRDLIVPLLDTLSGLTDRAQGLQRLLRAWDGDTGVDRPEPLVLYVFLELLGDAAWDEAAFRNSGRRPPESTLLRLLYEDPASVWLDRPATPAVEHASDLLAQTLEATADTLRARYGADVSGWRWGDHHHIVFKHITESEALRPLWRGPYEFPGFMSTLSPAGALTTTHSASWRVVVDFSAVPPKGFGVYPGGQSGNPASPFYDLHLPAYLAFEHYPLRKPQTPADLAPEHVSSTLRLIASP